MNYYRLDHSSKQEEIGVNFPQIRKMSAGYDYDAPNSVHILSRCLFRFPDFDPNLDSLVLHGGAKLTDVLSAAPLTTAGFLISEKLKAIFDRYNIVPVRYYQAPVIDRKKDMHNYYWMHIAGRDFTGAVDYKRSTFFLTDFKERMETVDGLESLKDLLDRENELREKYQNRYLNIKADKIVLDHSVAGYAFLSIQGFDFDYYINEDLKKDLVRNSISGISILPAPVMYFTDL